MQKNSSLFFIPLILFLVSCSESDSIENPSSFMDDPVNLNVGDCFNDFSNLDLEYGDDNVDAEYVEVVSCLSPHNNEVFAVYSSVPLSYRDLPNSISELCFEEMLDVIRSFHPSSTGAELNAVLEDFDNNFQGVFFFHRDENNEPDPYNTIVCSISSKYTLTKTYLSESLKELN
ncbi:MAG: hypothetical protein CMD50_00165 [Gammaproteobacteria bacterium]|nr:hypothetical protein [Gammaproteobacteria bacterium]|tara:strand:- start:109 stop:630 length:522 start_codon:yes stop_codon:yes gene_type:complete